MQDRLPKEIKMTKVKKEKKTEIKEEVDAVEKVEEVTGPRYKGTDAEIARREVMSSKNSVI